MSIGISDDHVELAASLRKWAEGVGAVEALRAAESRADETFDGVWSEAVAMGVPAIGLPEAVGGGGGSPLDVAVALEACAHAMLPGPLLGSVVVAHLLRATEHAPALAEGEVVGLVLDGVVWDAPSASRLLVGAAGSWYVVPAAGIAPVAGLDLSRRLGRLESEPALSHAAAVAGLGDDLVRRTVTAYAAAEAAGVARWCLETAVAHAKVREQFGQPIGRFQAVKHLCAQMLETAEAVTAAAWDAAAALEGEPERAGQSEFAAAVAAVNCFDGAVEVAKACIQVLGGIGFTFEHDAHLYLRRALALRALVGDPDAAALALTDLAVSGVRRSLEVDLDGRDAPVREAVRALVADVAALPEAERRGALADAGLLVPHWPEPWGRGADAVEQIVIDEELARAGVARPDLVIAGWALPTIVEHGTDEQRERFVRPSLRGELEWCQLFSEPGAGSDLASLRTRAVKVDGGWRLTGQKVWNSVAERADWGICLARTDPDAPQHRGIGYFLVDMRGSEGIDVRPLREITGEALFNEVFLDDVLVPDDCLVAGPTDGWRLARTTLANERVAMGSSRLGTSTERAVAIAAGRDLPERQRVRIGRAVALAAVCSLLGVRTTLRSLAGAGPGAESSVAKLLGVRNRQDASELVVELLGPQAALAGEARRSDARGSSGDAVKDLAGDVWEMLNTRCLSIAGGTTQVLRNVAGERILGLPR